MYPLESHVGSFKCGGKHSHVYLSGMKSETFNSTSTNQNYEINYFNCNESSLIYLLTCNICRKQYVGQTLDIFHSRWNNCKSKTRNYLVGEPCLQKHIVGHVSSEGHTIFLRRSLLHLLIKLTHKIQKRREHY